MATILNSSPLRQHIRRIGRAIYFRLPAHWRDSVVDFSYRHAGRLFSGFPHYETWRGHLRDNQILHEIPGAARLTDLSQVTPLGVAPGRIAIHAHVYYHELAKEFAGYLRHMPFAYDLFVSVTNEDGRKASEQAFRNLPQMGTLRLELVPNRGRDLAPMLCTFGEALLTYDYIAHIHTKKSLYNKGATAGWREYLLGSLLGDKTRIRRIFSLLHHGVGLVYPQAFHRVPYAGSSWMANRARGRAWCARIGVRYVPQGYFDFPVGSMFWARMDVLRPLFEAGIGIDEFDVESGQNDGTFAHVVERMLGVVARDSGKGIAILRDTTKPSWSPWRLEQYIHRRLETSETFLAAPDVSLVVFDIFDTLLTRPLIDPEQIKAVVARRAGGELGAAYLRWRVEAEQTARERAGRDVGLSAIMAALGRLAGLDDASVARLHDLEIEAEVASVQARPDAVALFNHVLAYGKRVLLASDMFLPSAAIESMLRRHGFDGWHGLYVSSEIGVRKDAGTLYDIMLRDEAVRPQHAIMVGDNEHSDLQIPGDLGWRFMHVMRPVELGRAMARLAPLIEDVECGSDLDAHLGLGLLVRGMFGKLHYADSFDAASMEPKPDGRSIGYAIAGPLLFAFSQWVLDQARASGVDRLYFLAREGQFLKTVYDRVALDVPDAPPSAYLVVSRRALNVPAIKTLDDALSIAGSHYGPGPLEDFLLERFGLAMHDELWQLLRDKGLWEKGQMVEVSAAGMGRLPKVLEALLPAILAQGEHERPALMEYLTRMGLGQDERHAVVDVGFSGTIQRGLNSLLGGRIDGYYMATLANAMRVERQFGVTALGAYYHAAPLDDVPLFISKSFVAEKLLSANDTQLMRYALDEQGVPVPEFRELTRAEETVFPLRSAIRSGALQFVDEAIAARDELLPDFRFPLGLAASLFESFVVGMSPREARVIGGIMLDDHYCGRGIVS
jgi:predicted HAD superfamily hydrolase